MSSSLLPDCTNLGDRRHRLPFDNPRDVAANSLGFFEESVDIRTDLERNMGRRERYSEIRALSLRG
jgi:hypothetical protein